MAMTRAELDRDALVAWLSEDDPARLATLWEQAEAVRQAHVGPSIRRRGLIEIGNVCERACLYCGLRASRAGVRRYRMTADEILEAAHASAALGYDTAVLQSGEDPAFDLDAMCGIVARIKAETPLAVTLSLGERSEGELTLLREAGADRYLLKLEASNPALFARIHPPAPGRAPTTRVPILHTLRRLGYMVGSGGMVGIPGQTWGDLADDLLAFAELGLDMVGIGPFIPHPETPLGRHAERLMAPMGEQVPASVDVAQRAVALTRLLLPAAHLPATTAIETLGGADARARGLARGANVVMHNMTPWAYRADYDIYPNPARLAAPGPSPAQSSARGASGPPESPSPGA